MVWCFCLFTWVRHGHLLSIRFFIFSVVVDKRTDGSSPLHQLCFEFFFCGRRERGGEKEEGTKKCVCVGQLRLSQEGKELFVQRK
jgi:hypothetical protein